MKMTRTIKYIKVDVKAIGLEDGVLISKDLNSFSYTGRKISKMAMEKKYEAELKESGLTSLLFTETEFEKKYEIELDDFLSIATEIIEEKKK